MTDAATLKRSEDGTHPERLSDGDFFHQSHPIPELPADDGRLVEGCGVPAASTFEAIHLTAQQGGIFPDPFYSAKGMAGLIAMVQKGFVASTDTVQFLKTGGASALFAVRDN